MRAWAETASPRALDHALRRALARLQAIDHDLGHVLRQVIDRKLHLELGFGNFDRYVQERADVAPRTAPGCTGRRNLKSHHIVLRSAGGEDEPSNRTTLCAFHHLRGIHAGTVSCHGRAPDHLVFALGLRAAGPPLLRAASGDVILRPRRD